MQDIRIIFLEYIYISGIISQILLCLTSKRCQRYSIMLGFHRTQVDWLLQMFSFHKNCPLNGVPCNGTEDRFRILSILQTLPPLFLQLPQGCSGSSGFCLSPMETLVPFQTWIRQASSAPLLCPHLLWLLPEGVTSGHANSERCRGRSQAWEGC